MSGGSSHLCNPLLEGDSSSLGEVGGVKVAHQGRESSLRSDGLDSQESEVSQEEKTQTIKEEKCLLPKKCSENKNQKWVISNGSAVGPEGMATMTIKLKLNESAKTAKKRKSSKEPKTKKEKKGGGGKKRRKRKKVEVEEEGDEWNQEEEEKRDEEEEAEEKKQWEMEKKRRREERKMAKVVTFADAQQPKDNIVTLKGPIVIGANGRMVAESMGGWGTHLPESVLVNVFGLALKTCKTLPFLSRMTNVCKLWRRAATSQCLWRHVDLANQQIGDKQLGQMAAKFMANTRELSLAGWNKKLTIYGVQMIASNCLQLNAINLSGCNRVTQSCVQVLVDGCPQLRHIDLSAIGTNAVSPLSVKYLVEKCGSQLTHLIIAQNNLTGFSAIIKNIAEKCPKLEVLDVSNLCSNGDSYLPLECLQSGCPEIRVLRLANSRIALSPLSLACQAQSPGFPNLEELSIASGNGSHFGDNAIERLLKTSVKLKLLDARGCPNISVSALVKIPAWDLEHLHLSKCDATMSPELEIVLKKWCHSLVEVDLSWSPHAVSVNRAVLALTAEEGPAKLRSLDVGGSAIGLGALKSLLLKCPLLDKLNLQSCRGLPRGIKRLYRGFNELEKLKIQMNQEKYNQEDEELE